MQENLMNNPIDWLWKDWLAAGELHVLVGPIGSGKTMIASWLAATVSRGGHWPDGSRAPQGNVIIILSNKNDRSDLFVPRILLANGNTKRIFFVDEIEDAKGKGIPIDLGRDITLLEEHIAELGNVNLIIIDSIDLFFKRIPQKAVQDLADFATRHRVAILGISYFNKMPEKHHPAERFIHASAFVKQAKIVWLTDKIQCKDGQNRYILCQSKNELGQGDKGYEYQILEGELPQGMTTAMIQWGNPLKGTVYDLLFENQRVRP